MKNVFIFLLFIPSFLFGQNFVETELTIETSFETIQGNLIQPNKKKVPLVIIIPGSGPTDRNGNNSLMVNNSLKFLAEELAKQNIATYRYDKSVLTFKSSDTTKIKELKFEHFIDEAKAVITHFKNTDKYSKIVVAGHSQGSLVGMIAGKNLADGFISIAGAGRSIDSLLLEQIEKNSPMLKPEVERVLQLLKKGELVTDFNPVLISLFNIQTQPFLMSWMQYNPKVEIAKLTIPTLLVNGTKDLQISVNDVELLHQKCENSKLLLIDNMNHVLKIIEGDFSENLASYTNSTMPISTELVTEIVGFINN